MIEENCSATASPRPFSRRSSSKHPTRPQAWADGAGNRDMLGRKPPKCTSRYVAIGFSQRWKDYIDLLIPRFRDWAVHFFALRVVELPAFFCIV